MIEFEPIKTIFQHFLTFCWLSWHLVTS